MTSKTKQRIVLLLREIFQDLPDFQKFTTVEIGSSNMTIIWQT